MQQIRRPRTNDPHELEKWQDEVSRQITNSQSGFDHEVLFWLLNEGRNPEKNQLAAVAVDVEDLQLEVEMISMNSQDLRDVSSKVDEVETKFEINQGIPFHTHECIPWIVNNYNTDHVLYATDFCQIHIMDVSGGDRTFTLPDISSGEIGKRIILVRKGGQQITSRLILQTSGNGEIYNSGAGGRLECNEDSYDYQSVELIVFADDIWGSHNFGIFYTT